MTINNHDLALFWLGAVLLTERRRDRADLEFRATHDTLTGLLNRATFYALLDNACRQRKPAFALLYLDLNKFKLINDTQGHVVGDVVLKATAKRIVGAVRDGDAVARMGGDEFAVLLPATSTVEAAIVCDRVAQAIREPLPEGSITSACGIASYCEGDTPDTIIDRADKAMYVAKRRQAVCQADTGECAVPLDLIQDLDLALRDGGIVPYFQPIAVSHNRRFVGYEVLARWTKDGRLVSPGEFIPVAEEAGWMPRLDWLMLDHACQLLEHFPGQWLSVNISGATLLEPGFREQLSELMTGYFISPEQLSLEISESIAIGSGSVLESEGILQELGQLATNLKLFVDDYGSAYAQLKSLMELCQQVKAVRAIKIDAGLVRGLAEDAGGVKRTICLNTIQLAHGLGLDAIAEGVEDQAEALALCGLGCDYLQGYHIGYPLPIEEYLPG
jgi:diguanylate cyclase (GGDEF)-like protein